jgi:hypothetical protein
MDDLAPILAFLILMMVPVVAILTKHQQKMAAILHSRPPAADDERLARVEAEVAAMRDLLNRQALILEELNSKLPPAASDVEHRLRA